MKKYLVLMTVLILSFFAYQYAVYSYGFYLHETPIEEVQNNTYIKDKQIYINEQPFIIKGVSISSALPNHNASDYDVDEETYAKWIQEIYDMGANTLRVATIMDDDFYNAFYAFNMEHLDNPMYLLQGIRVSDYGNNTPNDAYDRNFYDVLKEDGHSVIDIFHGSKNIVLNRGRGLGYYRKDISKWVLGIQIGDYWNTMTLAYTNHHDNPTSYDGKFVKTSDDADAFETLLARLMDDLLTYEANKYGYQHLITFANDPTNDPFEYQSYFAGQLSKYVQIDAQNILMKDTMKTGIFASYHLYEFAQDYKNRFSDAQKEALSDILPLIDESGYYEGYMDLLHAYYDIPVVVTNYGFSTSRGSEGNSSGVELLTEQEQGQALMDTYQDIVDAGCSGAIINHWQDEWGLRTWNTMPFVDVNQASYWSDIQTVDHGYGLMSFDPGEEEMIVRLDGNREEWKQEDVVYEDEHASLSMKQDERYLYFMAQNKQGTSIDNVYIPIDVTNNSGTNTWEEEELQFDRPADFLLHLQGSEGHLYVQSRYEAARAMYLMQSKGEDPYIFVPEKDDPHFQPILMMLRKFEVRENSMSAPPVYWKTYETGALRQGNGDPESEAYDSLADYQYGNDCVEIRIPWQLLNFGDPSRQMIHDDYYENYGVELIRQSTIYAGVSLAKEEVIEMNAYDVDGWKRAVTHERLKQSYDIVKSYWRELP